MADIKIKKGKQGDPYEYKLDGDRVFTRKIGSNKWISLQNDPAKHVRSKVFGLSSDAAANKPSSSEPRSGGLALNKYLPSGGENDLSTAGEVAQWAIPAAAAASLLLGKRGKVIRNALSKHLVPKGKGFNKVGDAILGMSTDASTKAGRNTKQLAKGLLAPVGGIAKFAAKHPKKAVATGLAAYPILSDELYNTANDLIGFDTPESYEERQNAEQNDFDRIKEEDTGFKDVLLNMMTGYIDPRKNIIPTTAGAYGQYMTNAILQDAGLLGEGEAYTTMDNSTLSREEQDAMIKVIQNAINRRNAYGMTDYRDYSDSKNVYGAKSSDAALQKIKELGALKFTANPDTMETLAQTTGTFAFGVDENGDLVVVDSYDFNPSQANISKLGANPTEVTKWLTSKKNLSKDRTTGGTGLFDAIINPDWNNLHIAAENIRSAVPVKVNLGDASRYLTDEQIETLKKKRGNMSEYRPIARISPTKEVGEIKEVGVLDKLMSLFD